MTKKQAELDTDLKAIDATTPTATVETPPEPAKKETKAKKAGESAQYGPHTIDGTDPDNVHVFGGPVRANLGAVSIEEAKKWLDAKSWEVNTDISEEYELPNEPEA